MPMCGRSWPGRANVGRPVPILSLPIYSRGVSNRPLSEQAFLVLTALADQPQHGYAILNAVRRLSDDRVRLPVGTLYGVLDRLSADGLVEHDHDEVHDGRLRRYYRPTNQGISSLHAEINRLTANARAASTVLRSRGHRPETPGGLA
jgi:DNA-binding PadR family transcriptional regulator